MSKVYVLSIDGDEDVFTDMESLAKAIWSEDAESPFITDGFWNAEFDRQYVQWTRGAMLYKAWNGYDTSAETLAHSIMREYVRIVMRSLSTLLAGKAESVEWTDSNDRRVRVTMETEEE